MKMAPIQWISKEFLVVFICLMHFAKSSILKPAILQSYVNEQDEDLMLLARSMRDFHPREVIQLRNGHEEEKIKKEIEAIEQLTAEPTRESFELLNIMEDMIQDAEKEIQMELKKKNKQKKNKKNDRRKRFTINPDKPQFKIWDNGVIPYQFHQDLGNREKNIILYLMQMFEYYTPIRFVQSNEGGRLNFVRQGTCWSYLGKTTLSLQTISCCSHFSERPCKHELCHAFGLHHEHQNPYAQYYVSPNDVAIPSGYHQWFHPLTDPENYRFFDHVYDIDSLMSYHAQDFSTSKTLLDTLTVFDPEHKNIIGNKGDLQTDYYIYKEINQLYDIETLCPNMNCSYDGFAALIDGNCACQCPDGLTGDCTAIEVEDLSGLSLNWPNDVGLIQTKDEGNCPDGFYSDGWMKVDGGTNAVSYDTIYNFDANIVAENGNTEMKVNFCKRNSATLTNETPLPKGSYCILKSGSCPSGFTEGSKKINNGGGYESSGNLPSGISTTGDVTSMDFCCRRDTDYSVPVLFPTSSTFILFPTEGNCQTVKGMHGTWQMVKYHNNNDKTDLNPSGFVPRMYINSTDGDIILYMCYYTRLTTNCGGIYNLDSSNRQVTISTPNYPQNYDSGARCTWVFKSPPGTFMNLAFNTFNFAINPDGTTKDELEIRNTKIGNYGLRYSGFGVPRNFISEEHFLSIIFYSSSKNFTDQGFSANVTLIDAEALCYSSKGENYDGVRNITVYNNPCLDWKEAADRGCQHDPYAIGDELDSLDNNFCRNPGHGLRTWCYIDFNGACKREDCDVCGLRGCDDADNGICDENLSKTRWCNMNRDVCKATCDCEGGPSSPSCEFNDSKPDCQAEIDKLTPFCDTREAIKYCAKTCHYCDKMQNETLVRTCSPPSISDAAIENPESSYNLGDQVTLRCVYGNGTKTQVCSSTGKWVPKLDFVCDIVCQAGYTIVGDRCFKVIKNVQFDEGKQQCEADNATMMMMKTDRSAMVTALLEVFSGLNIGKFWLDLTDDDDDDHFLWGDGTNLTWTKWRSKPFILQDECRQHRPNSVYSTRAITKSGQDCLYWNSVEVMNMTGNQNDFDDNFCRSFDMMTTNLYCYYNASGQIVKEDCDHIPFCYEESSSYIPRNFNGRENNSYTGLLAYANLKKCLLWSDVNHGLTDQDFVDGSITEAKNYCRSPDSNYADLWCYTNNNGVPDMTRCTNLAQCSNDVSNCRTWRMTYAGNDVGYYIGTQNSLYNYYFCKNWATIDWGSYNSYFTADQYNSSLAGDHCRIVYWEPQPWCRITVGSNPYNVYCSVEECCHEQGYTQPSEYLGERSYAWVGNKLVSCMMWDEVQNLPYDDDDFPDGSVSDAKNYCRAPDQGDYLFCYVRDTQGNQMKRWCDVPMDQNMKDAVYYDVALHKWIPTYKNNFYDVVCEAPEEDHTEVCLDEDKTTCRELFTAKPSKCKATGISWGKNRCRKTCGYCSDANPQSPNTDTCSEPTLDPSVTKVTPTSTVAVGEYFEYSCTTDKVAQGNLQRGCLPDGTLTGENPTCVDQELVNEWINNSTIRDRAKSNDNGTLYFSTSGLNTIHKNGYLTAWSFFALNTAPFSFFVLRNVAETSNYTVVNYTYVSDVQAYRSMVYELTPRNQFPVQRGDLLGWLMLSDSEEIGGVPLDTCNSGMFPDDTGEIHRLNSVHFVEQPGSLPSFRTVKETKCNRFSLTARVGPHNAS